MRARGLYQVRLGAAEDVVAAILGVEDLGRLPDQLVDLRGVGLEFLLRAQIVGQGRDLAAAVDDLVQGLE